MESLLRNKWIWFILGVIILIPLILNWILDLPALYSIVGDDEVWLSFWGSYIGSIFSSLMAVFILYKQLNQNHEENKTNRKLQLTIFAYQRQKEWLNKMREACIKNVFSYDTNEIVEVLNIMLFDKYKAFSLTKKYLADLAKTDTCVAFLGNENTSFRSVFHSQRKNIFKEYSQLIEDIKLVVASLMNSDNKSFEDYCLYIKKNDASETFVNAIRKHVINNKLSDDVNLSQAAAYYIDKCCPNYLEKIRKITQEYLNQENKRLNDKFKIPTNVDLQGRSL